MRVSAPKYTLFLAILSFMNTAAAQNRTASDRIFNESQRGGWTQIFLGIAELAGASSLANISTPEGSALVASSADLKSAHALPTSEAERRASINAIFSNNTNFEDYVEDHTQAGLTPEAAQRMERLRGTNLLTAEEKAARILSAEANLSDARAVLLRAAQNQGLISKSIRFARLAGSTVLVIDVLARLYVWNGLDANPTLSPAATYLQSLSIR